MSIEKYSDSFTNPEQAPFTTLANVVLQNLKNPEAFTLWCYLQSLPKDWNINKTHLRKHFSFSVKKLDKALSLLTKCNLLEFVRPRDENGIFMKGYYRALSGSKFIHPDYVENKDTTTPKIDCSGNPPEWEMGVHTNETVITNEIEKQNVFFENDSVKKVSELESLANSRLDDIKKIYPNSNGEEIALKKLKRMGKEEFNELLNKIPVYLEALEICKKNGFNRPALDLSTFINQKRHKEADKFLETTKKQYAKKTNNDPTNYSF